MLRVDQRVQQQQLRQRRRGDGDSCGEQAQGARRPPVGDGVRSCLQASGRSPSLITWSPCAPASFWPAVGEVRTVVEPLPLSTGAMRVFQQCGTKHGAGVGACEVVGNGSGSDAAEGSRRIPQARRPAKGAPCTLRRQPCCNVLEARPDVRILLRGGRCLDEQAVGLPNPTILASASWIAASAWPRRSLAITSAAWTVFVDLRPRRLCGLGDCGAVLIWQWLCELLGLHWFRNFG